MAREPYILVDDLPSSTLSSLEVGEFIISGEQAHHLTKVLRAGSGYRFVGFDGKGNGWRAEVVSTDKKRVCARIIEPVQDILQSSYGFTVAVGIIKGNRMDWAVEKAAELGAIQFIPLLSRYSVVSPGEGRIKRWKTVALSAAKQSHRFRLMDVTTPMTIDEAIQNGLNDPNSKLCLLDVGTGSVPLSDLWNELVKQKEFTRLTLFIGPEGGFSDDELNLFKQSKVPVVSIGHKPLRTETAVTVALGTLANLIL